MAKKSTSVSVEEEVLDRNDAIRKAIKEQDEFGRSIGRSGLIEDLLREWNEENAHYMEEGDTGNQMTRPALTAD